MPTTNAETREIILKAIEYVKAGWCQGGYVKTINGVECVCSAEAIRRARIGVEWTIGHIANRQIRDAIEPLGYTIISEYNDAPHRTQSEVIALLQSVADGLADPLEGWREIEV